ncbi:MAG: alkaline phosphatase family protein [Clostridiales bacterium]|nr:alkaline phosphatase family protein [Clostridiales bacterium]
MKFLKVLANALLSGLFFSALLALLFADLNINMKISLRLLAELALHLATVYGFLIACACLFVFFMIQFFSGRAIRIAFVSPSFLCLSFSLLALVFLVFFRANTRYFHSFFDTRMRMYLQTQFVILASLAVLGLLLAYASRRTKKKAFFFLAYFLLLAIGLSFIFFQRFHYPLEQPALKHLPLLGKKVEKRITLIGLEGLNVDLLIPLISERKLPNFSWLMDNGSSGRLINFSPTEPVTINASLDSGKFPAKHRRLSLLQYRIGKMKETLEIVPRFMLFNQLERTGFIKISPVEPTSAVTDIWQVFEANRISAVKRDWPYSFEVPAQPSPRAEKLLGNILDSPVPPSDEYFERAKNALFRDCAYEEAAVEEKNARQPQIYYLLLSGLNTVQAYFYKFHFPEQFGHIEQEHLERYGPVIDRYHDFYDQIVGKFLTGMKEDELLVVFSPHGMEPLPLWKRAIESLLGNALVSAHHEFAPDGVVFFYGKGIARGKNVDGLRIVDIAPTLLYYLGLPVGRDMDGIVRTDIFIKEFITENPVIYISSYDDFRILTPQ